MAELDSVQKQAQAQFDKQSERYGKGHILADVDDVKTVLARVPRTQGSKALDVATGAGHTGLYLASQGWQVTLADISQVMLNHALAAANERGVAVETRQHAAEEFPYDRATFDLVTCRVAAHHFSSPEMFVHETARVLKPGGAFILIDGSVADGHPEVEEWLHQVEKLRDPSHGRFLTPNGWSRLCQRAGLRVISADVQPFKQPDLNWYFETAATSQENRVKVLELVRTAPSSVRSLLNLGEEEGKIVWWWQRLTLLAVKD